MRAGIVFVGVMMLVAGCSTVVTGTPTAGDVQRSGPKGAVPAGLEQFYSQALVWSGCPQLATDDESRQAFAGKGLQCATMRVPLDYAKPAGPAATIGLLRRPADDQQHRVGSLVINPGGPGASGMTAAAGLYSSDPKAEVFKRFDVVGFDPRGIGVSSPKVHCLSAEETDQQRLEPPTTNVAKIESENKDYAAKCVQRTGADVLATVGTRDVARDMDVLRSVLGDEKLTYLGFSYGTRIGTEYAQQFPQSVRAMVLDGAVDPDADQLDEQIGQAKGFDGAIRDFVKWCVARDDCALGRDPKAAQGRLEQLVNPLKTQPAQVGDRQLSFSDAATGIIQAMYSNQLWEPLNTGLTELAQHQGRVLMILADAYLGRGEDGQYSNLQDAFTAINCVDQPQIKDRAQVQAETTKLAQAAKGTFLDEAQPPVPALDVCAFWPVPPTSVPHRPTVTGLPPVLVISTTGDPATPYQSGVDLADALHGGLLTFQGTQHTAFLQGNECVDNAGSGYLIDLKMPAEGTRCT
jgi:pimeloyl-ACP methyl ester carboxylesterase